MKNYLIILMIFITISSCTNDETAVLRTETAESVPGKTHVYNQNQISRKFGRNSNLGNLFKTYEAQNRANRFIIDTDWIYSVEEENFHSLTYLVAYPDQPDRIVNLIFFSNDYQNYHPAIVEYDLTVDEVIANQPIPRNKIKTIPIRNAEDYTTALNKAMSTKLGDCVTVTIETVGGKCESGKHGPGEPCDYAGGPGSAKVSYRIIYDFSNCDDENTGGGNGGTPPTNGYPGGINPGTPPSPPGGYQPPYFGGGHGPWVPSQPVRTVPWWPQPGRIKVMIFKNGLNADQKQWWSSNVESPQRAGIFKYVSESGDHEFAAWAIDYFIETPATTWKTFVNWFMVNTAEHDGAYDAEYWENPTISFPPQSLPKYEDFYNAFPLKKGGLMPSSDVYKLVGGQLYANHLANPKAYGNACAIRVSRALNYSGIVVPEIKGQTEKGIDNLNYFLSAKNLNAWMEKTFGVPAGTNRITGAQSGKNGENIPALVQNKQGIYIMIANYPGRLYFGATGHADIIENGTCPDDNCYFNPAGGVNFINIWELN